MDCHEVHRPFFMAFSYSFLSIGIFFPFYWHILSFLLAYSFLSIGIFFPFYWHILSFLPMFSLYCTLEFVFHSVKYISHTVVFVSHSVKQRIFPSV